MGPRFASALSTAAEAEAAIDEACTALAENSPGPYDLVFAFFSHEHADRAELIARELSRRLRPGCLLGCTGESIIGAGREIEEGPAFSLWSARLPDVSLTPLQLSFESTPDGGLVTGWPDELIEAWPDQASLLILGEPFSFPMEALLQRLNEDRAGMPVMGGMASGGVSPGQNRLLLGEQVMAQGAAGVLLHGAIRLRTVLSQGCRPIGKPLVITRAERNEIFELGGKPALIQLKEIFDTLPTREQQMVQNGLHVGRVVDEYRERFEAGDFLIRNVVGLDPDSGSIAIADFVRPGQTIQFHIRDEESASRELREMLGDARDQSAGQAAGGLLFSCNGRGTRLFSRADHDAAAVRDLIGDIPLAGFFAQGEIGPIGGQNFVHGFTASVVLFENPGPSK